MVQLYTAVRPLFCSTLSCGVVLLSGVLWVILCGAADCAAGLPVLFCVDGVLQCGPTCMGLSWVLHSGLPTAQQQVLCFWVRSGFSCAYWFRPGLGCSLPALE
jgi:hypothetical protein